MKDKQNPSACRLPVCSHRAETVATEGFRVRMGDARRQSWDSGRALGIREEARSRGVEEAAERRICSSHCEVTRLEHKLWQEQKEDFKQWKIGRESQMEFGDELDVGWGKGKSEEKTQASSPSSCGERCYTGEHTWDLEATSQTNQQFRVQPASLPATWGQRLDRSIWCSSYHL